MSASPVERIHSLGRSDGSDRSRATRSGTEWTVTGLTLNPFAPPIRPMVR